MKPNTYFLPGRIKKVLSNISNYPATVVEAPSGFGKTTAVREFLKSNTPKDSTATWITCLGEPTEKSWDSFCSTLSQFDADSARYLKRLKIPTDNNLADIAYAMKRCDGNDKTYIVIDNFQFMSENLPASIIDALAAHGNPNLHIIFITQPIQYLDNRKIQNENILHIGSEIFIFNLDDTREYLAQKNINLDEKSLADIYKNTEGWIAALNLQRIGYEQLGKFEKTADMDALIKSVIWNHLSPGEKDFLMSVSVLDSFTYEQARIMSKQARTTPDRNRTPSNKIASSEEELPDYANALLETNDFIRFDKEEKAYVLHALFHSYLTQEFDKLSDAKKEEIWKLAGQAYASRDFNYSALLCFLKIEDYDSIFNLPLRGDEFTSYISAGSTEALINVVENCPEEIMRQNPMKLMVIAFELFMTGGGEAFAKAYDIIKTLIQDKEAQNKTNHEISDKDYRVIAGESARLESFMHFNDIEKMSDKHREALTLLHGPSTLQDWRDSWTFGQPSVLYLFWSKSGELNHQLDLMDQCLPYYYKLTYGHGTGAESLMRAEALLMKGNDKAAELLCHKALYMAASKDQDSICYGAELVLARIAMLRGDLESLNTILSNMNKRLMDGTEPGGQKIVDLAYAFLETSFGFFIDIEWLSDITLIKKNLYPVASFYGIYIYMKMLLINKEYSAVYGLSQPILEELEKYNFLLPKLYFLIFTAIAKHNLKDEDALKILDQALDIAVPDRIYMPFAEQGIMLEPLLRQREKREGVKDILDLTKRLDSGIHRIRSERSERPILTQREREIAELASLGLTNNQIAAQLFISVNTVKVLLKRVFAKLNIKSRTQLSDYL